MKKKIGGFTIGSILTVLLGILAAFIWWGAVHYPDSITDGLSLASMLWSFTL